MGKIPGKWLRNILTGKKDKEKEKCETTHQNSTTASVVENPATPMAIRPTTLKEKRRWSFRRSSAAPKDSNSAEPTASQQSAMPATLDSEDEQKKHAMAMAAATAAAADAAVAAAQAAAAVIRLAAAATTNGRASAIEEAASIKIQSVFRSYLARKALSALRGLVKLQSLVRGHLVRKQATAMLRCMEALVTVQARARAQRIQVAEEGKPVNQRQSTHRKSTQENRYSHSNYDIDGCMEENIKIVEMDRGEPKVSTKGRNSYSHIPQAERAEYRISAHYPPSNHGNGKKDSYQVSPAPSALTDMSPRACSSHFEDYSFNAAQSSPQCYSAVSKPDPSRIPFSFPRPDYAESLSYDCPLFPNYMANTESSRAKVRSQSAPKQRPDAFERQPSRRRASMEGRNVPRAVRMQRSSSHVGSTAKNYQYPWSIRLDKSAVSLKDSECGSTSTVLTNTNYCRSLVGFDIHGDRY